MPRIAIIQLARYGDLVSALPFAKHLADSGNEVTFFTHPQFADLFEATSYVKFSPVATNHKDVAGAVRAAEQACFDKIIKCQVDGNKGRMPFEVENYQTAQWARAGFLDKFHELPLVFDRRDEKGDVFAVQCHVPPEDGRPLLGFCLKGQSSPYFRWPEQQKWIVEKFGKTHRLLNFADICVRRIHNLVALIEACDVLLTVDTLHLHLAYATLTPTLAMSTGHTPHPECRPSEWYNSEPRKHWIFKCTYAESLTDATRAEMERIINTQDFTLGRLMRTPPKMPQDRVWHVFHWFWQNEDEKRRVLNAHKTWDWHHVGDFQYRKRFFEMTEASKTSRDIGDTRRLPRVADVIDFGAGTDEVRNEDIVVLTNSDICLTEDAINDIRKKLKTDECCFSRRVDVKDATIAPNIDRLAAYEGTDLFAMRVGFWRQHQHELPQFYLGCEGFDFVLRHWMRKYNPDAEMVPPVCWHELHQPFWALPQVVQANPAQVHNRETARKWAMENKCAAAIFPKGDSRVLFRSDHAWMISDADRHAVHDLLKIGSGSKAVFLPFIGEVGWLIMHYMRLVHFSQAKYKIVCCRPGQEVLFPTADEFCTGWHYNAPDTSVTGTGNPMRWEFAAKAFPDAAPVPSGSLSNQQEFVAIAPGQRIEISPKRRGLQVDVCIGARRRELLPAKNWPHWQKIADALTDAGLTFAVIGTRDSAYTLEGMTCMSGDYGDFDAAVELLQNCRLFVGADSGSAHLASVVDSRPMIVQNIPRPPHSTNWGWVHRMKATATQPIVEISADDWENPEVMIQAITAALLVQKTLPLLPKNPNIIELVSTS